MEFNGRYKIGRPVDEVWAMLFDPDVLQECIPGCLDLTASETDSYEATVQIKLGPIKAKFAGKVTYSDIDQPRSFKLSGEGRGGVAGAASGHADIHLESDGEVTVLTYTSTANVIGKIAQLGSRLIQSTARSLTNQFFDRFEQLAAERPDARSASA